MIEEILQLEEEKCDRVGLGRTENAAATRSPHGWRQGHHKEAAAARPPRGGTGDVSGRVEHKVEQGQQPKLANYLQIT